MHHEAAEGLAQHSEFSGEWPPLRGDDDHRKTKKMKRLPSVVAAPKNLAANQVEFPSQTTVTNPHAARRVQWDLMMLVLILYVLIETPFELSFIGENFELYVTNKFVDVVFFLDLCSEFNLAYFDVANGKWVVERDKIASRYFKSWFALDVLALLPYSDLPARETGFLRLVRLLRLLKMLRALKNPRIFSRLAKRVTLRTGTQAIIKYIFILFLIFHWSACALRNIDYMILGSCKEDCPAIAMENFWHVGIWGQYTEAVEFAVATLNSDMRAVNISEAVFSIIIGVIGCYILAFLVGDLCNVITNLSPVKNDFRLTIDSLNDYLDTHQMPEEMRRKLREYMILSETVFRENYYRGLLARLSPGLRSVVANHNLSRLVKKLPFFQYTIRHTFPIVASRTRVVVLPPPELDQYQLTTPNPFRDEVKDATNDGRLVYPLGGGVVDRTTDRPRRRKRFRRGLVTRVGGDLKTFDVRYDDTGEIEFDVDIDRVSIPEPADAEAERVDLRAQRRLHAMLRERDQFVVTIAKLLETQLFMPRDTIVSADLTLNTTMFAVHSGKCLVFGRNAPDVLCSVELKYLDDVVGDDICMLTVGSKQPVPRHYTAIVAALTQVHSLSGEHFADVVQSGSFPVFAAHIRISGCWQHLKRGLIRKARRLRFHLPDDDPMLLGGPQHTPRILTTTPPPGI